MRENQTSYRIITEHFQAFCNKTNTEIYNDSTIALSRFYELSQRYLELAEDSERISIRLEKHSNSPEINLSLIFTGYNVGFCRILNKEAFAPIFEEYLQTLSKLPEDKIKK